MKEIPFQQMNETLYYEQMDNGLDVYILPKGGFQKTFATFTTKYGSIDNHFQPLGQNEWRKVPDGIAHFLEHKMFEKEDGDVFQQFTKQGASANAFTSFTRTAYLFSSTDRVNENVETLLDFVQEPYFAEDTVEKEKGIIGQEITMYDDNADWRLYFGLIANLYHEHPVKIDIAGTKESIAGVTKDLLYECYNTFYHPSNMLVFIVGAVDADEMMEFVRTNQNKKSYKDQAPIERKFAEEPTSVAKQEETIPMNVQNSKCMLGIKSNELNLSGEALMKREQTANMLLDMLFSLSSEHYTDLYEKGLIDDSFSYDFTQETNFGFAAIGGDTNDPDAFAKEIRTILLAAAKGEGLKEEALARSKKKKIGTFLRAMNSPEFIANQFTRFAFNEMDLFEVLPTLEGITLDDVQQFAKSFFQEEAMSVCKVVPKGA